MSISSQTPTLPDSKQHSPWLRKPRTRTAAALLVVSGLALVGWASFGVTVAVTTTAASEQAASLDSAVTRVSALSGEKDDLSTDLATMTTSRDSYKNASDSVITREVAVTGREDAVKKREDAVTTTEKQVAATTLADGVTYTVGQTMEPGTYQTTPTGGSCYWAIYTSGTNYSDIVDNDLGAQGTIQVRVGAGQDFTSKRCGAWTKVG